MLPIAAAASGQGRFGSEIEKWDEKRQEKKRKQNATDRPRTQALRLRRITTTIFLTRHKQIAFYGAFLSSIFGNEKTYHSWSEVQNLEIHYHIQVRWDSVPESNRLWAQIALPTTGFLVPIAEWRPNVGPMRPEAVVWVSIECVPTVKACCGIPGHKSQVVG
jgi:hypothetical protein